MRMTALPAVVCVAVMTGLAASCSGGSAAGGTSLETRPAASHETFDGVSTAAYGRLDRTVPVMRGVRSLTYDPTRQTLTVYFASSAVLLDQRNVENIVTQAEHTE
jgi:hypothetical protein